MRKLLHKIYEALIDIYFTLIVRNDDLTGISSETDYYSNRYNT